MTSSSWGAAPAAVRWPGIWRRQGSGCWCSSAGTGSRASRRTGLPRTCSSTTATSRRTPGTTRTGAPFQPQIHYFVGGATKLYGAALYRLRPEDFGELQHHDGLSPAWPISYDELEPYYTQAEHLYEVHGAHGEDPTEGQASAPYPFPAVSHEPRIQQLSDDLEKAGYHPFHAPCGIRLNESNLPYSACVRCQNCDGFPCAVHGKSDADVLGIRPALEQPNVTLLTNAVAERLETNSDGTAVTGVVVDHDGATETLTADVVVLACGAANTAKLLLRVGHRPASQRACQRLRPGRPQLHVPQQPGRAGAFDATRTRRSSRRRWGSTTSTSRALASTSRWATSRWSASRRRRCSAARSRVRPGSRRSGRWRTSPATPSTSGSRPRTCPVRRTASRLTARAA